MTKPLLKVKKKRLRIAVVLYGQQRFHHPSLGILRTVRILNRLCADVQVAGHLWADVREVASEQSYPRNAQSIFPLLEVSSPELIQHTPQDAQDANLVKQATSQRQSFQSSLEKLVIHPDLVLITRTDLLILNLRYLVSSMPDEFEVWNSNFHHSRIDDNIALMSWASFQKLDHIDFASILREPDVLHGEHLRDRIASQAKLSVSDKLFPYVILRADKSPLIDLGFAFIRMVLRRTLPSSLYLFATSPKHEFVRLSRRAFPGSFRN